jgi:hypothetical protein
MAKAPGAQRAGGFAEEMEFLPAGFTGDDLGCRLEILDATGDVGISGSPPRLAVIFMVHGPAVESMAGEFIHHGIFAVTGHVEVKRPRTDRGAVDEEQHRPRWLAGLRCAETLAIHPQGNIALLGPVFAAPDFAALARGCSRGPDWQRLRQRARDETEPCAPDDGAPSQNSIEMRHDFLRPDS